MVSDNCLPIANCNLTTTKPVNLATVHFLLLTVLPMLPIRMDGIKHQTDFHESHERRATNSSTELQQHTIVAIVECYIKRMSTAHAVQRTIVSFCVNRTVELLLS